MLMLCHSRKREQAKALGVPLASAAPLLYFLLVGCGSPPNANPEGKAAIAKVKPSAKPSVEPSEEAADETPAAATSGGVVVVKLASINTTTPEFKADVQPLLKQICADCHFNFTMKEAFETNRAAMLRAVKGDSKSMPPKPTDWRVSQADIPAYKAALEAVLKNYDGK
jgi:hypothetical protein